MIVIRYSNNTNTSSNAAVLIKIIKDLSCLEVTLFATQSMPTSDFKLSDGFESNLPLIGAIAKYSIPEIEDIYVVFDGVFLTASRRPRYLEVKEVLDCAEKYKKVNFISTCVPFTSSLTPAEAMDKLLQFKLKEKFNNNSRSKYFSLICSVPEDQYP